MEVADDGMTGMERSQKRRSASFSERQSQQLVFAVVRGFGGDAIEDEEWTRESEDCVLRISAAHSLTK